MLFRSILDDEAAARAYIEQMWAEAMTVYRSGKYKLSLIHIFMQDVRKKIKALFVWMAEVKEELSKPQTPSLADLLIAYYNQRNDGAWSNKARTGNLKQFAEAVNYLTENKLLTLEAVSYTHLDVYKRQALTGMLFSGHHSVGLIGFR